MTDFDVFVDALVEARRSGHRFDASCFPSPDYGQALQIQRRVQSVLGPLGGFKVSRRAAGTPGIAPIRADRIFPSAAAVGVRDVLGVELEIGFEVIADPCLRMMDNPELYFRPRIVLEIVDTRMIGVGDDDMKKLADMQSNEGLVVGPALESWDGSDFSTLQAVLRCGADTVLNGAACVPGGSALGMLQLFLDHVGEHCGGLRAGQIVITGSLSPLRHYPSGARISGSIEGIGGIACRFT